MSSELERAREAYEHWRDIAMDQDPMACTDYIEALEAENARKDTALATILGLIGNVDHKGGGANAARMYADMLNDIRVVARRAREGGNDG